MTPSLLLAEEQAVSIQVHSRDLALCCLFVGWFGPTMMKSCGSSAAANSGGRNVVVCCDGTGIGEDHRAGEIVTPSNIVKIFNCIDTIRSNATTATSSSSSSGGGERPQIAYYERGVGSVGNVLTKAGQGLTGYGIGTKIMIMYHWYVPFTVSNIEPARRKRRGRELYHIDDFLTLLNLLMLL